MATNVDGLSILRGLRRSDSRAWGHPMPHGSDGWRFIDTATRRSAIVTCASMPDGFEWVHASMTGVGGVPGYDELRALHGAVFGAGWSYLPFAPPAQHINIHDSCLHLFGRLDGQHVLPDFSFGTGSI